MAFVKGNTAWKNRKRSGCFKGSQPWNTGKSLPEQMRKKISEAHLGKVMGEDVKQRISATMRKRHAEGVHKGGFRKGVGLPKSIAWRKMMSQKQTENWKNPKSGFRSVRRQRLLRLARATQKNTPHKGTSIEKKVQVFLDSRGISYITQYGFGNRFVADFYIPAHHLVIECDGDYWHSLPNTKRIDACKRRYCRYHGFTLIRLREIDINTRFDWCCVKLCKLLNLVPMETTSEY